MLSALAVPGTGEAALSAISLHIHFSSQGLIFPAPRDIFSRRPEKYPEESAKGVMALQSGFRIRLSPALSAALVPALTVLLTALALWCQPNDTEEVLTSFQQKPILYALNALPVGLFLSGLTFLFRNVFFGAAAVNAVVGALSIANRLKIEIRDEPVFPRDLALWKEAGDAVGAYHLNPPVPEILAVVGVTLALFALGLLTTPRRKRPRKRPQRKRVSRALRLRLGGAFACFVLLYGLIVTVYASNDLYDSLKTSSPYRLSVVFNENGFLYNFCHQFTKYQVERPAGYDRAAAQAWDEAVPDGASNAGKNVNVVLVMNEAFSDITDNSIFAFAPDNDPLTNLHAIRADAHALSLRLVVPGFAGGTANTEFDVFTGMRTNALGAGTTSAMRTVNRNLDSLFRVFNADGYRTAFYHPGEAWFYNRENVYRWFGASETRFIEEMEAPAYKGRWVTDDYLAGLIEAAFAESAEWGELIFHASTTIQNHMAYPYSKYGDGYEYPPVPVSADVSPDVREVLEVYAEGARDADAMLGRLRDFFAARREPVLLVFYGDHLPYLFQPSQDDAESEDNRLYQALFGFREEDAFSRYETPCVIWANDAAAELLDWERVTGAAGLPENGRLSAAYLGALLLELTGRGQRNAWTAFLNELRRQVPVAQEPFLMLPDGAVVDAQSVQDSGIAENIRKWRQWSYYKLEQKARENFTP